MYGVSCFPMYSNLFKSNLIALVVDKAYILYQETKDS